jgi:hypothetical protein
LSANADIMPKINRIEYPELWIGDNDKFPPAIGNQAHQNVRQA